MKRSARKGTRKRGSRWPIAVAILVAILAIGTLYVLLGIGKGGNPNPSQKPIILYINQGNGVVNGTGFGKMLSFASEHGFNTIFFQAYRQGKLLDSPAILSSFVNQTHDAGLKIFFALYITNASQALPTSIFGLHEDGVSLDMTALNSTAQERKLSALKSGFSGETAVTMPPNPGTTLTPDLLIFETYLPNLKSYIKPGIVASVLVSETSDLQDYQSQFQYALQNSDGVMVFDYAGLLRAGY